MIDDWMMNPPWLNFPPVQKTVDPDQLQKELQRAFGAVTNRVSEVEQSMVAQLQVQNLILRALVDTGNADYEALQDALSKMSEGQDNDAGRAVLNAMKESLKASVNEAGPHLKLVPKPDQED